MKTLIQFDSDNNTKQKPLKSEFCEKKIIIMFDSVQKAFILRQPA